jgi:hypothetical protein
MRAVVFNVVVICLAMLLGACAAGTPRDTRLTARDIDDMAAAMASKLEVSSVLAGRDASSEVMVVAMNRVENLTDDVIPRGEQWAIMVKVRDNADMVRVGRERGVKMVIPKEFLVEGMDRGTLEEGFGRERQPTHAMGATIQNATRSGAKARTDVYVCEFRMTKLASGEIVWTDVFELKRQAFGLSFD